MNRAMLLLAAYAISAAAFAIDAGKAFEDPDLQAR